MSFTMVKMTILNYGMLCCKHRITVTKLYPSSDVFILYDFSAVLIINFGFFMLADLVNLNNVENRCVISVLWEWWNCSFA